MGHLSVKQRAGPTLLGANRRGNRKRFIRRCIRVGRRRPLTVIVSLSVDSCNEFGENFRPPVRRQTHNAFGRRQHRQMAKLR
jgi:hypothetical protein